ncbi:MAG: AAA family ATPase [Bacilli bacterium]|nr:AAA family ATPase [Bacilli bacterium]
MNKVIAIVGMCGSGKSVASDILENDFGYKKVYFGGVTIDKLKEEGLDINPENEKMMRERLREELGMGAFAKILLPKIKELSKDNNVVLDGLYSWDEYKILSKELNNIILISIIADKNIRYDRLSKRDIRPLTKEQAINRDISEIENIAKAPPIAYADYYILNNGTINEYKERLIEIIGD